MDEELKKEITTLTEDINKKQEDIVKQLNEKVTPEQLKELTDSVDTLKESINTLEMIDDKKITDYVKAMQEQADKMAKEVTDLKAHKGVEPESLESKIKSLVTPEFMQGLKDGSNKEYTLEKGAADLLTSDWTADTGTTGLLQLDVPGVAKQPWRKTPILAAITKRFVGDGLNEIRYTEELTRTDSAALVAEAGTYAQSAATWIAKRIDFYKYGHYAKVSKENISDSLYIMGEIDDLLRNGLLRDVETEVYTADGSSKIKGVQTSAKTISAKPYGLGTIANANLYDCLRAGALWVAKGYNADGDNDTNKTGFQANIALVSPAKLAEMEMQKDTNGNYILPPFRNASGNVVAGMTILASEDLDTEDTFLVGDFTKAVAYIKQNLVIETSDNVASDFIADLRTIKASMRLAFLIKSVEEYAFATATFANVTTYLGE